MKRPWMPLYVGDYLADTGHLTTTQHGAYMLLIMHYWRTGGIPNDDKQLSKITKMNLKIWVEYRPIIQDLFYEMDGDPWKHKRIEAELFRMVSISEKRKQAGAIGGTCSAIARVRHMKMPSLSKHASRQANAEHLLPISKQMPSKAAANVHHSHSHKIIERSAEEKSPGVDLATAPLSGALRSPPASEAAEAKEATSEPLKRPQDTSKADLEAMFEKRRSAQLQS